MHSSACERRPRDKRRSWRQSSLANVPLGRAVRVPTGCCRRVPPARCDRSADPDDRATPAGWEHSVTALSARPEPVGVAGGSRATRKYREIRQSGAKQSMRRTRGQLIRIPRV